MRKHPEPLYLSKFMEGTLESGDRDVLTSHLADCPDCCREVGWGARVDRETPLPAAGGGTTGRFWRIAAAAAILLSAGLAAVVFAGREAPFPSGEAPDWVQAVPADGSRWRWGGEDKNVFHLEGGSASFDVDSGRGTLTVRTPAGTVRVLGTRFGVRVIGVPPVHRTDPPLHTAFVRLHSGTVSLENEEGDRKLSPGQIGILVPGYRPKVLESVGSSNGSGEGVKEIWKQLLAAFRKGDRREAAYFLTALAPHEEIAREVGAKYPALEGEEGAWMRKVFETMDWRRSE